MRFSNPISCARLSIGAVTLAVIAASTPVHATQAFKSLSGRWGGSGTASFTNGQKERLRCNARYSGGGASLSINVRCASSSAQINLSGSLSGTGSKVSGHWSESSYGLGGSAYGSSRGNAVRMRISGDMSGYLTLTTSGSRHTFSLSSKSSTLSGVRVTMSRR